MSSIIVPSWLMPRSIDKDDLIELQVLLPFLPNKKFEDLTATAIQSYYHSDSTFNIYRIISLLGFYGVFFRGKLASYSSTAEQVPLVLSIPTELKNEIYRDEKYSTPSPLFQSLGIKYLRQLHGVPVSNIENIFKRKFSQEDLTQLFHADLIAANDQLFQSMPILTYEDEAREPDGEGFGNNTHELTLPISQLHFSVRTMNCLTQANIHVLGELLKMKQEDLLEFSHFGKKSLIEVNDKLASLGLHLYNENFRLEQLTLSLDLESEEILNKLHRPVTDFGFSVRSRNGLGLLNILYVWELVQVDERTFKELQNMGKKSVIEIKEAVESLGFHLGMHFNIPQLETIQQFEPTEKIEFPGSYLITLVQHLMRPPLSFLKKVQIQILRERTLAIGKKQTLEEIANNVAVTRERIRQLEAQLFIKIKLNFSRELRESISDIKTQVSNLGGIANFEDLDFQLDLSEQEKIIASFLVGLESKELYFDWENLLISSKGCSFIEDVVDSIKSKIQEKILNDGRFIHITQIQEIVVDVIDDYKILLNGNHQKLLKRIISEEVHLIDKWSHLYNFGGITKQIKYTLAFKKLFPEGLEIYKNREVLLRKFKEYDSNSFGNLNHNRSIEGRLTDDQDILQWGRGFVIHKDHVSYDNYIVHKVANWIKENFDKGNSRFRVFLTFKHFKNELIDAGIPNPYALYTTIRLLKDSRIGQRKFPTFVDLEADVQLSDGTLEELENFIYQYSKGILYSNIREEFLGNRGWLDHQVYLTISHSELIFPWGKSSCIHLENIEINETKLNELIAKLDIKLKSLGAPYSLKAAKYEMGVLWEEVCPSAETNTMAKIIRVFEPEGLIIEREFIRTDDESSEFDSASDEMESYFLDQNREINIDELEEEFRKKRGWGEQRLYAAKRKAKILKTGNQTYIHPFFINWNITIATEVVNVLSKKLKERNEQGDPHMQIEELIDDDVLPELPNEVLWSKQLMKSLGDDLEKFIFFDDAYVELDNEYNISTMDDMIAFLMIQQFPLGLAKKEKVEKLLLREGILEGNHSIPASQFFKGSSIEYLEESNEIKLSPIGKMQYGNN